MSRLSSFTVVICTRNRAAFLRDCLGGLTIALDGVVASVMVVDNGSTDTTPAVLSEFSHCLRSVFEPKIGLSHARNRAVEECETEYIVFLDDDGIPEATWGKAIAGVASEGTADVFGGPYVPYYTTPKPAWFDDSFGSAHLELKEGDQPPHVCFSGGNMGWRTRLVRQAGGFDPALGVAGGELRLGEETSLQIKLRHKFSNLRSVFLPDMIMRHHVAPQKMTLAYIHKRNYIYGWQLPDIDPANQINSLSVYEFMKRSKLGLPLISKRIWRNRKVFPYWSTYAAKYLSLNSILLGAQVRRLRTRFAAFWRTKSQTTWRRPC